MSQLRSTASLRRTCSTASTRDLLGVRGAGTVSGCARPLLECANACSARPPDTVATRRALAELAAQGTDGHSKDHRRDLPQVVTGLVVTRGGIPIRVWTWPGNASDQELIRQVKEDLRAWKLSHVVWVTDTGFNSAENRRYLQRAGGHYIVGDKLRAGSKEAESALSRPGRYHKVAGNLEVKEVVLDDGTMRDRFVICRNPEAAEHDQAVRAHIAEQLEVGHRRLRRSCASTRCELASMVAAGETTLGKAPAGGHDAAQLCGSSTS